MFNANDFKDEYIRFDRNFEILKDNKDKIIFAPNGVGKSSIYKSIQNKNEANNDYFFIDYESMKDNFVKNKKKISFGPNIEIIHNLEKTLTSIEQKTNLEAHMKSMDIKNKGNANKVFDGFSEIFKDNGKLLQIYTTNKLDILEELNEYKTFVVKNFQDLKDSANLIEELELIKDYRFSKIFKDVKKLIDEDTKICPICSSESSTTIKNIIVKKEEKLDQLNNTLVRNFIEDNPKLSNDDIKVTLTKVYNVITEEGIENEDIVSFACTDFSNENEVENRLELQKKI